MKSLNITYKFFIHNICYHNAHWIFDINFISIEMTTHKRKEGSKGSMDGKERFNCCCRKWWLRICFHISCVASHMLQPSMTPETFDSGMKRKRKLKKKNLRKQRWTMNTNVNYDNWILNCHVHISISKVIIKIIFIYRGNSNPFTWISNLNCS